MKKLDLLKVLKDIIKQMNTYELKEYIISLAILEYGHEVSISAIDAGVEAAIKELGGYESAKKYLIKNIDEKLKRLED